MRSLRVVVSTLMALFMVGALSIGSASAQAADNANCAPGQPRPAPPGTPPGQNNPPTGRPAQYPPGHCNLLLSRSSAARGESVTASGSGFAPGESVTLSLAGSALKSVTADPAGAFTTEFVVPNDAPLGRTEVLASGSNQTLNAAFEVVAAPAADRSRASAPAAAGAAVARTGAYIAGTVLAGLALLALGTVLVVMARRRRIEATA